MIRKHKFNFEILFISSDKNTFLKLLLQIIKKLFIKLKIINWESIKTQIFKNAELERGERKQCQSILIIFNL